MTRFLGRWVRIICHFVEHDWTHNGGNPKCRRCGAHQIRQPLTSADWELLRKLHPPKDGGKQ